MQSSICFARVAVAAAPLRLSGMTDCAWVFPVLRSNRSFRYFQPMSAVFEFLSLTVAPHSLDQMFA
jgi:hypothetical protein